MKRNNNLDVHNTHTLGLGRAEPVLPCLAPGCIRRFYNRSGRTSHMRSQHLERPLVPEEPQPSSHSLPNDDDSSSSQSGDHAMPGPARLCSDSPSRPGISCEDDATQGDVEIGFDPALNLFDGGYNDGGHDIDGERSSSPHRDEDQAHVAPDGHVPHVTSPRSHFS
jgi:hypothetical protein